MNLILHPDLLAICKLPAAASIPDWLPDQGLSCVTRTNNELSIVCQQDAVPAHLKAETDWQALEVEGPLDFSEIGILANLSLVLASAEISIFVISTHDTDFILIKKQQVHSALEALRKAGHQLLTMQGSLS